MTNGTPERAARHHTDGPRLSTIRGMTATRPMEILDGVTNANASRSADRATASIGTILLASDLGTASLEATDVAVELAARLGARLLIMNALDTRRIRGSGRHDRLDQARAEREAILLDLVRHARRAGVTAEFMVWPGAPVTAIREAAEAEGADLLVVGSHGRDRAGRLVLGSVSEALVRQAACPVLVARPRPDRLDRHNLASVPARHDPTVQMDGPNSPPG